MAENTSFTARPVPGPYRRNWYDLYADGVKFAEVRPTGGTEDTYDIFMEGSTRKYDTGARCPDRWAGCGKFQAFRFAKEMYQQAASAAAQQAEAAAAYRDNHSRDEADL